MKHYTILHDPCNDGFSDPVYETDGENIDEAARRLSFEVTGEFDEKMQKCKLLTTESGERYLVLESDLK